MILLNDRIQYVSKFRKLSSPHRTIKVQFAFQSQRKTIPKNVETTVLLLSFHMLANLCSKSFKLGFSSTCTEDFQICRGTRDQIANLRWIIEKGREFQKNSYFCFIDYTKSYDCVALNKLLKRWEYQITLPVS